MKKLLVIIVLGLLWTGQVFGNSKLIPLSKFNLNDKEKYSRVLARCGAIQVTELSLTDPNADKRFDDMGLFVKENMKFIKFIIPGKSDKEDAQNSILLHEYFVSEYQKVFNKSLISGDRSFCSKIKKKL
jgi:hypothetical protein|tara:strand:- start:541 stop:927 length:387 start_codon:yes stop_codon:yes gene_type:complete